MWSIIPAVKTAISYVLYVSFKTGQLIITSFNVLLTNCFFVITKLITLLRVILEDFTLFLQDVTQTYYGIVETIVYGLEWVTGRITETCKYLEKLFLIPKTIVDAFDVVSDVIYSVLNGIKNIFIFIKTIIILFGDGVWFIVVYIPKSLLSLGPLIFYYIEDLIMSVVDCICINVKLVCSLTLDTMYNCYYFVTDVPVESTIGIIIGICFLYVFIQFYAVLFMYLKNKVASFLTASKLKYNHVKVKMRNILLQCRPKRISRQISEPESTNFVENARTDEGGCVVCQDNSKCILVLPCKHLCLCDDCVPRLMRYSRHCPICRKRIRSTMKVYV